MYVTNHINKVASTYDHRMRKIDGFNNQEKLKPCLFSSFFLCFYFVLDLESDLKTTKWPCYHFIAFLLLQFFGRLL